MRTFKDRDGQEWTLDVTIEAIRRVKGLIKVDLGRLYQPHEDPDSTLIDDLEVDTILFGDVLLALVRANSLTTEIDQVAFMGALDGPSMEAARAAFWGELADFFRSNPRISALLKVRTELLGNVVKKTETMTAETILAELAASGISSTNAQESLASTPAP